MIDCTDVTFTYDGTEHALDGVSLHVDAGEFVCVLGGNGSGKSTLAKHLNALLVPDEGTVRIDGHDTSDADATFLIRSTAGMVFQNPDNQLIAAVVRWWHRRFCSPRTFIFRPRRRSPFRKSRPNCKTLALKSVPWVARVMPFRRFLQASKD